MVEGLPCDDAEVSRIAQDLVQKYGYDAVGFATARADRATEIGDKLAHDIWQKVLAVVSTLKAHAF